MAAFLAGLFRAPPRAVPGPRGTPLSGLPLFHGRRRRRPSSSVVCMAEPYLIAKLDSAEKAWKEMSVRLADPDIVSDPSEYQKLAQSVSELDQVVTTYRRFKDCEKQLEETKGDGGSSGWRHWNILFTKNRRRHPALMPSRRLPQNALRPRGEQRQAG